MYLFIKQKKFENVQGLGGKICHKIERDYLRLNNDGKFELEQQIELEIIRGKYEGNWTPGQIKGIRKNNCYDVHVYRTTNFENVQNLGGTIFRKVMAKYIRPNKNYEDLNIDQCVEILIIGGEFEGNWIGGEIRKRNNFNSYDVYIYKTKKF